LLDSLLQETRRGRKKMVEDDLNQMLSDVQDSLEDICYSEITDLDSAVENGLQSQDFTKLVCFLVREVSSLSGLEDQIQDPDVGGEGWIMELSSLLRELGCPHNILTEGPVTKRLETRRSRLILLDFLMSELMAARMIALNKPTQSLDIQITESPTAAALKQMLLALGFPKPPDNITPLQLWEKVTSKVQEVTTKAPSSLLGSPLLSKKVLTGDQWKLIDQIAEGLNDDYCLRRRMLLTRLDATVQSFTWSDRMKGREGEIGEMYRNRRSRLAENPGVGVADMLAAREDATIVEKVCSSQARQNTRTSLNKVIIGSVPDRGGRTETMQAPPPEMPSWQQRQPDQGRGGGQRGGGRGRGGYQGNSNQGGGGYQGNYQSGGGGYQGNNQGNYQGGGGYQGNNQGSYQGGGGGGYQGNYQGGGGGGYQGGGQKGGKGSGRVQGAGWSGHGGGGGDRREGGGYSRGRGDRRQRY